MNATDTQIPKLTRRTWLSQSGESASIGVQSLRLTQGTGRRINIHRWLEDGEQGRKGEVVIRGIKGDAWRKPEGFREYSHEVLMNPTDDQIVEAIYRAQKALS